MKNYNKALFAGMVFTALSGCQNQTNDTQVTKIENTKDNAVSQQLVLKALDSSLGYEIVESLTVEVGPRLAGSEKDIIAVEWAMDKLKSLGFDKVYKESVQVPAWYRGSAKASITAPYEQPLVITALGGSVSTPEEGIQANIVRFDTLTDLQAADPELVKGKIAFIDHKTERHISGKGYGKSVGGRSRGAVAAAEKGAVAVVIRSIGTDHDRMAHTGMMRYKDGVKKFLLLRCQHQMLI